MANDDGRDLGATYERVRSSFGAHAANYTTSQGHADTRALDQLIAKIAPRGTERLLDVGTGAGHTALAFAPAVAEVVALDVTPEMLEEVQRNAAARGIVNLSVRLAAAESLPFADASFDLVTCRLTTHHFAALPKAVREMARVLRAAGRLAVVDTMVPEDDELDREINAIELMRDPSHVRNCRPSEWRHLVEDAGLSVTFLDLGYYDEGEGMDFAAWTARIGTPPADVERLRALFRNAGPRLVEALKIVIRGDEIRFALPRLTLIAAR